MNSFSESVAKTQNVLHGIEHFTGETLTSRNSLAAKSLAIRINFSCKLILRSTRFLLAQDANGDFARFPQRL